MRNARRFLVGFCRAEGGATGVEYALILAIACCAIAIGAGWLVESMIVAMTKSASCIEAAANCPQ